MFENGWHALWVGIWLVCCIWMLWLDFWSTVGGLGLAAVVLAALSIVSIRTSRRQRATTGLGASDDGSSKA